MKLSRRTVLAAAAFAAAAPAFAQPRSTASMPQRKATTNKTNFQLPEDECWRIISRPEQHPVLATVDEAGVPYAFPISTCVIGRRIYFHGAMENGRRYANVTMREDCSMVFVVDGDSLTPGLNINKRSVIVQGKCRLVTDNARKLTIARALLEQQNPAAAKAVIDEAMKTKGLTIQGALSWYEVTPVSVNGKIIIHKYL